MFLNPALGAALDRIAERAADVRRAFVPGAMPANDDAATGKSASQFTLDALSVALADDTYFLCRDSNGETAYARDGSFTLVDGTLRTANGLPVLGTSGAPGLRPLQLDPVDTALGRVTNVRIDAAGTLTYERTAIDPRSGRREPQRVTAGRLAVARFPAATLLPSADGRTFAAPERVVPHVGTPGDEGLPTVRPMQRQRSGVDLDASLARLKAAYVAFDALAAAETAKGRLGKTAMDLVK